MVVRVVLVDVAVQERLRGLSRVRVVLRFRAVVLELVGGEADSDRRTKSPSREAGDPSPSAHTEHRVIVEETPGQVKANGSGRPGSNTSHWVTLTGESWNTVFRALRVGIRCSAPPGRGSEELPSGYVKVNP